jgi:hypothetical protein
LLERPLGCQMRRDVVMEDLSRPQFPDLQYIVAEAGIEAQNRMSRGPLGSMRWCPDKVFADDS